MTGTPRWIFAFDDPPPEAVADAQIWLGGKGASLAGMRRAGLHVPPGFTITAACCAEYFRLGQRWPDGLQPQLRQAMARLEAESGRTFGCGPKPLLVSVRSGAAVSMPGMMDTLLNCGVHPGLADALGDTPEFWQLFEQFFWMFAKTIDGLTPADLACDRFSSQPSSRGRADALLAAYAARTGRPFPTGPWDALTASINAVFDSWNSQRAVAYRQRHRVGDLLGTAVNVQMMFPSEVSGIVFTRDPNRADSDEMIVEASYGLGEAVVSGEVTPDRFRVRRGDLQCTQCVPGRKTSVVAAWGARRTFDPDAPALDGRQLAELASLALRVEEHFGCPLDIEWGWAEGEFALLQARPIRGLDVLAEVDRARREEIARLRVAANGRPALWVAHNLGETLRFPTPLTWEIMRGFMRGDGGFGRMYRMLGYRPSPHVCREGFLDLIGGRVYADPSRLAELFWDGMPLVYDPQALRTNPAALNQAPTRFDPEKADHRFLARLPANLLGMWRTWRNGRRLFDTVGQRFERDVLPSYLRYVEQKRAEPLDRLPTADILRELHDRRRRVLDEFGAESLLPGFFGGLALDSLTTTLSQLMGHDEGAALASTLTRGLDGDTTFEQDALLYRVALGQAAWEEFLERFGHRAIGEMELAEPRWREDPSYPQQMLQRWQADHSRNPIDIHHDNVARFRKALDHLPRTLRHYGGSSMYERIQRNLHRARRLLPYRESGKHYLMMGYELLRLAVESLARRYELGGDIYFLTLDELDDYPQRRGERHEQIAARRLRWQAWQRLDLPEVIDAARLDELGLPTAVPSGKLLEGTAVAAGVGVGVVRVVFDPRQANTLPANYVLVCPSTDPGWTPLFLNARALVVERGGVLSHGAIVARDFGIPAVVCEHATQRLRDGQQVRVDGNHGRVHILDGAEDA